MALPTDGYKPLHVTYSVYFPEVIQHDVVRLDVRYQAEGNLTVERVDELVHRHMEALYADVLAESGVEILQLRRIYHGERDDDITPTPPGSGV